MLVHYTGETNYPLSADDVHEIFLAWQGQAWTPREAIRSAGYRVDFIQEHEPPET